LAVHAELLLHRTGSAVGCPVVAQRRALPGDAGSQRRADGAREPDDFVARELVRGAQRAQARTPEGLVRVDVPEAGDDTLVEEDGLQRGLPARELSAEPTRRELRAEGLGAVLRLQVRLELRLLEDEPCSESPDVAVHEP
jgi:hypothetical protein